MEQEPIEFDGEIIYIEPLGADVRIADIIEKRVEDALK
jgi:sirohydrochlorin cobaltochelatase